MRVTKPPLFVELGRFQSGDIIQHHGDAGEKYVYRGSVLRSFNGYRYQAIVRQILRGGKLGREKTKTIGNNYEKVGTWPE